MIGEYFDGIPIVTWASLKVSQQPVVIGFDLDMTLLDTRPGIAATYRALTARTGVHVDAELAGARLGPPLRTEMSEWFPPESVEEAGEGLSPLICRTRDSARGGTARGLGGAGGGPLVRRADRGDHVEARGRLRVALHLAHLDIPVDEVHGDVFAAEKASVLRSVGATAYVGDHVADMQAGVLAGVPVLGVTTGPCSAADLQAAGASLVSTDLHAFPAFLRGVISVGRAGSDD